MTKYGQAVKAGEAIGLAALWCPGSCDQAVFFPCRGSSGEVQPLPLVLCWGSITGDHGGAGWVTLELWFAGVKGSGVHEASAPSLAGALPRPVLCQTAGCLSASALVVPTPPTSMEVPTPAWGDVSEHVCSAFEAHGEDSEGDTATMKAFLSPCSLGTSLVGGGDG